MVRHRDARTDDGTRGEAVGAEQRSNDRQTARNEAADDGVANLPTTHLLAVPQIAVRNVIVDRDGDFTADVGAQRIPGLANPISGSDLTVTVRLVGQLRSADLSCGSVEGSISTPIVVPDLTGSTWAAIRVPPQARGEALPAPVALCP